MAHLDINHLDHDLSAARQTARVSGHVHHAQVMLMAAGIAAFGIVAVAAAMMTTLL